MNPTTEEPETEAAQVASLRQQVLRNPGVRALVGARFTASLGIATLAYGAMVYLATVGASQASISLVGSTRFIAALLFGIGGGALVDATSKRTAIVSAYLLQAAACFIVPTLFGTSVGSLIVLVFLVASLGQVAIPAVKAATALVSTVAQVAAVAAIIAVAGGIGAAMGSAFLAPFLINVASMRTIIYVAGVVLLLGAWRARAIPDEGAAVSLGKAARTVDWKASVPSPERTAVWLLANRKVAAMILVGSIVIALFEGFNTLMPVYVRDVLGTNPTHTIYILAPGGFGFLAGTALGPWLMDRRGERALGVMALAALSLGLVLFGLIDIVAPVLAPFSPLRVLNLFGIALTPQMQAAGLISILTAFGSTAALAAVQTYVNRYVLLARQATTFGMQEVLDNALTVVAVLGLGIGASLLGSRLVFILAPPLIVAVVVWLIQRAFRITQGDSPAARAILQVLLDSARDGATPRSDRPPGGAA
ncbi:MAG: MFS transporter [Thermomicrobiales bacterium]|nr:MFS transporter [Thermomicrobiales bacterium]